MPISHKVNPSENKKIATDESVILKSLASTLTKFLKESTYKHADATEKLISETSTSLGKEDEAGLKTLSINNKELIPKYLNQIEKKLLQFKAPISALTEGEDFDGDLTGLELVDNEEVEAKIAIEGIISRAEGSFHEALYGLNKRLAILLNADELTNDNNPLGPKVLANSYVDLLDSYAYSTEIRLIHFNSFDSIVMLGLGELYKAINLLCIEGGVLAKLPKEKILKGNSSYSETTDLKKGEEAGPIDNEPALHAGLTKSSQVNEIPAELYSSLIEIANVQRLRSAVDAEAGGPVVVGSEIPTEQLLGSLTSLQKTELSDGTDTSMTLRTKIADSIQVNGERQPYLENDEILIDVVAMFFDVILQDKHLPETVRMLLAQLQIPILKVSMIDKEFFAKKSHPARRFLNDLSKAGLGVCKQNDRFKNHVFEKMENLVERVLMEFECDVELFSILCEDFSSFMEHQQRQVELIEERSRKVTQSSEKLDLARRQAAYEIAVRLQGLSFPQFVRDFLEDAWKDVLVLAILRQERDPKTLTGCLSVIDGLMASVVPISSEEADKRKAVVSSLPGLLKGLKVGLENISYDYHESLPWFKELEAWHWQVLFKPVEGVENHLENVKLVEIDEDESDLDLEAGLLTELEQELSKMPQDKYTKKVNEMVVGDWVEYTSDESDVMRAKLSWKSTVTLQCLFVNEMGAKALDLSMAELAESLREGGMQLVEPEKIPLVERVLASMKDFVGDGGVEASHG